MLDGTPFVISETGKEGAGHYTTMRRLPDLISKLAKYEDLEDRGMLFEFPCKVGDTVFFVRDAKKAKIEECKVEKLCVKSTGLYMKLTCNSMYETSCRSIGKTVFFDIDSARKACSVN